MRLFGFGKGKDRPQETTYIPPEKVVTESPVDLLVKKGRRALQATEYTEAGEAFTAALRRDPKCISALVGMARVRLEFGTDFPFRPDWEEEFFDGEEQSWVSWGRRAVELESDEAAEENYPEAWFVYARTLAHVGGIERLDQAQLDRQMVSDALGILENLCRSRHATDEILYYRARFATALGRPSKEAYDILTEAIGKAGRYRAKAHWLAAQILSDTNDGTLAADPAAVTYHYLEASNSDPGDRQIQVAACGYFTGQNDEGHARLCCGRGMSIREDEDDAFPAWRCSEMLAEMLERKCERNPDVELKHEIDSLRGRVADLEPTVVQTTGALFRDTDREDDPSAAGQTSGNAGLVSRGGGDAASSEYDDRYDTPYKLHQAAQAGDVAAMRHFVGRGYDPDECLDGDVTPLHVAAAYGSLDAVQFLVSQGVCLNGADEDGLTPLHLAARAVNGPIVLFLMDNGADARARDGSGRTPADLARAKGEDRFADAIDAMADG